MTLLHTLSHTSLTHGIPHLYAHTLMHRLDCAFKSQFTSTKGYASIAKSLINKLKIKALTWENEATIFEALKIAMTKDPLIALPNFEKKFSVETGN